MATRVVRGWPAWVTLLAGVLFVAYRLVQVGGEPTQLAELGTRYSEGDPRGTEGYDGQFALYMALDPNPETVRSRLDVPAYRYQRVLLPLAARGLALGRAEAIPWALIAVNLLVHTAATLAIAIELEREGMWRGFALLYGLWAGALGGIGTMLHEPLAYGLAAVGLVAHRRGRHWLAFPALGLALFAKETTLLFLFAAAVGDLMGGRLRARGWIYSLILFVFLTWQGWLWWTFGEPGIASGGAGATAFEVVPFMGLLRIATYDLKVLGLYLLLFGPGVILPAAWGLWRAGERILRGAPDDVIAWAVAFNAVMIVFLPFSTFREPFGLVRLATGLVLSVILFAAERKMRRPLVYAGFWLAYLALIFGG